MNSNGIVVILLTAVVGSGLGMIYTKHQTRKLFIELETLQRHRDDLEIEWNLLQLEQSTLATESVVDYSARTRLKMAVPASGSVIYVRR